MDKVELTTNSGTSEIPGNSENSGTSKTQDTSETPGTSGIYAKDNRSSFEIAYGTMVSCNSIHFVIFHYNHHHHHHHQHQKPTQF